MMFGLLRRSDISRQTLLLALILVTLGAVVYNQHQTSIRTNAFANGLAAQTRDLSAIYGAGGGGVGGSAAGAAGQTTVKGPKTKKRLQVIKAGGIPKEGLGSSLGFITAVANIAQLLDADLIITQTAEMMGYRVSDILNKGISLEGGGRTCDIMEILLDDPSTGAFQVRMDRAQSILDKTYERAIKKCTTVPTEILFSDYALKEISRCDTIIINDYRTISRGWTHCSMAWWKSVIDQYSGEPHGNDVAIHYRWGDMYHVSQKENKWRLDMNKVSKLVNIIREENPSVVINVFMKKSRENESERRMREILLPLSGEYNIIEAESDVEELAMMAKAKYLIINSGSYSYAAAATSAAKVVVFNNGGGHHTLAAMNLDHLFNYDKMDDEEFRKAVRD